MEVKTKIKLTLTEAKEIICNSLKLKNENITIELFQDENSDILNVKSRSEKETPEDFFNSIFNKDLTRKVDVDKYPNSQFYFDGETLMLEIEKSYKTLYAWFNYDKIWNPISTKNNWDYHQTQTFLKVRIEEYFKMIDITAKPKRKKIKN